MSGGLVRIWAWPVAIAAVSASGLVSALLSEGWGDAWSWIALGLPVAVGAWCGLLRREKVEGPRK